MKNTPIKKIRLLTASLLLGVSLLFSGCSAFQFLGERAPDLPDNAQSFKKVDTDSSGIVMEVNGRKYAPFGTLNGKLGNSSLGECLGYVDNDKNDRVYTLCEEPYGNYLVTKNVNGIMEQPMFWRDRFQKMMFIGEDPAVTAR